MDCRWKATLEEEWHTFHGRRIPDIQIYYIHHTQFLVEDLNWVPRIWRMAGHPDKERRLQSSAVVQITKLYRCSLIAIITLNQLGRITYLVPQLVIWLLSFNWACCMPGFEVCSKIWKLLLISCSFLCNQNASWLSVKFSLTYYIFPL